VGANSLPRDFIMIDFFLKDSPELYYILGFIVADGCICEMKTRSILQIQLSVKDLEILEYIKKTLNINTKIPISTRNTNYKENATYCTLTITSKELVEILKTKYDIHLRKSKNEKLPNTPDLYKKDMLRGILDGDGSFIISKNGKYKTNTFQIVSGSKEFLEDVNNKLCFGCCYVVNHGTSYKLQTRNNDFIISIGNYIYSNACFSLKRKKDKFLEIENNVKEFRSAPLS
jgi:intein-encoded DNA endonuclease-like protein